MTADVIALPLAETTIADLIEDAAARNAPLSEIAACVHPSLSAEEAELLWEDFTECARMREGLGTGEVSWREYEPELTCFDRQETAFQLAAEQADYARNLIQHGRQNGGF